MLNNEFYEEGRNILDYWLEYGFKKDLPLFYGYVDKDNKPKYEEFSAFLITARALWSFSAGYELYGDKKYLDASHRAYEGYKYFFDKKSGGYFRHLKKLKPTILRKTIYDQAFGIYGLCKYYAVSGNEQALEDAFTLFDIIEEVSCDKTYGGYIDVYDGEWNEVQSTDYIKEMNTMLHIKEAYTLFYSVTKDERVLKALKNITRLFLDKIYNKKTGHLNMFFDRKMELVSDEVSCGHDIEASWLLWETYEAIGDTSLLEEIKSKCISLCDSALRDGYDEEFGGVQELSPKDKELVKIWWVQAEAVVGTYNAFQLTGDKKYYEYFLKLWNTIKEHFIFENGEWKNELSNNMDEKDECFKIGPWKCPYHNFRMCYEIFKRLKTEDLKR